MSEGESETGPAPSHPPEGTHRADTEGDQTTIPAERLQQLQVENERLRREYSRARRVEYGRTAAGLALVGVLSIGAAVVFPSVREVLLIIGSIGLFAAVLTRFLTPERFLPVDVAEGIYDSIDNTYSSLVAELELAGDERYVPTEDAFVRLYVSQREGASLPDSVALQSTLVVPEDDDRRGVAFSPSAQTMFREFRRTLAGPLADTPEELVTQLAEGASEGLELVDEVTTETDAHERRVSMQFSGVPFGAVDRIDHPVVSFVGIGLATGFGTTVTVADARTDDGDGIVTYTWDSRTSADNEHESAATEE